MRGTTLALAAAMAVVCARAEAAVFTQTTGLTYEGFEGGYFPKTVFVPNFDRSLGTLVSTTFTIAGSAREIATFTQGTPPPTSGFFGNSVSFNGGSVSYQPITQITPASAMGGNSLLNNFQVNASTTYGPNYNGTNPSLDLTFIVSGVIMPFTCCYQAGINFNGSLTTAYNYNPVPEPISASLLLAPLVSLGLLRRKAQAVTTTA